MKFAVFAEFDEIPEIGSPASGVSRGIRNDGTRFLTRWSGTYQGVEISDWDDQPMHVLTDGVLGVTPQKIFGLPVALFPPPVAEGCAEVAFGTGGELAGEIFVYTIPVDMFRPGMTEDEAADLHQQAYDYGPEVRDYAPREGSMANVQPLGEPVYAPWGKLITRDEQGEPQDVAS